MFNRVLMVLRSRCRPILSPRLLPIMLACSLLPAGAREASAQNITNNTPDQSLRSNFEVNPSTLGLELGLTLGNYPGRGASMPVTLNYSSKTWRVIYLGEGEEQLPDGTTQTYLQVNPEFAEKSVSGWITNLAPPTIDFNDPEYNSFGRTFNEATDCLYYDPPNPPSGCKRYFVQRLSITMPDGSSHEFRKSDVPVLMPTGFPTLSGVYYAVDGSRLRYDADTATLYLPDGSRYLLNAPGGVQYIDRHGNTLNYNAATKQWTDTLGRTLGFSLNNSIPEGQSSYDQVVALPGVDGVVVYYTLRWKMLGDALTIHPGQSQPPPLRHLGDYNGTYTPSLFNSFPGVRFIVTDIFNPVVLSQITLPNGRAYTFTYNPWGEIDKVTMPSGGYHRYQYSQVAPLSRSLEAPEYAQGNRGVIKRWISAKGDGSDEIEWNYSAQRTGTPTAVFSTTITGPDGSRVERQIHDGLMPGLEGNLFGYENACHGRAYEERVYNGGNALVQRTLTECVKDTSTYPHDQSTGRIAFTATRNPRSIKQVGILLDTGGDALATTTTMSYDQDLNQTASNSYDYVSINQTAAQTGTINSIPQGSLQRTSETIYLLSDADYSGAWASYRDRNLLVLPTKVLIKNGSGVVLAAKEFKYDESAYPLTTYPAVSNWTDPQNAYLGNVTTVRRWQDFNYGTGERQAWADWASGTWIEAHTWYDQCGSVVKVRDGNNKDTITGYADNFYGASPQNTYAYPTSVTTPGPAFTTITRYDFSTGLAREVSDPNNVKTRTDYNDPLNRPTKIVRAEGTSVESHTIIQYQDDIRRVTTISDKDSLGESAAGNGLKSVVIYDGLGRTTRNAIYEGSTWSITDTRFDAIGRVSQVSNPYRAADPSSASPPSGLWTTTEYDALGRVVKVTTPDGAHVDTAYSGAQVTVTDQAGKKRRSETDALGRLFKVTEAPGVQSYDTLYLYDALDNLRKVTQGAQTRWFAYDSLSRLIRAKNPEQNTNGSLPAYTDPLTGNSGWSMAYSYDANGNLTQRIDARGIEAKYYYDALNRNWGIDYINGSQKSNLVRVFDGAVNGKGRLYWTRTQKDGTQEIGTNVTADTIDSYDALGRPLQYRQHFWQGGGWSPGYYAQQTYDLAGNVKTLTYPSGKTVNYSYDQAGRLSSFSGNLGGAPSTYADTIGYNAAGQMIKERFGTNMSLYHRSHYNNRLQLVSTRLGDSATEEWSWSHGAIGFYYGSTAVASGDIFANDTDNNGNLRRQTNYVPLAGGGYVIPQQHDYTYDALNRIATVREQQRNGSGQWADSVSQAFSYDRWGNRTLDLSGGGGGEVVWVDDALPAGASVGSDGGDSWTWVSSNPSPYSGTVSHQSNIAAGQHQHFFYGATQTLQVNAGDRLYAYVYLDPANMPQEVMLQWSEVSAGWSYKAYWGANLLTWPVEGTKINVGSLPAAGGWVRLEVPASSLGLEGKTLNGMAFTLYGGRASWDKAGKVGLLYGAGPPINNNVYAVDAGSNRLTSVNGVTMSYDAAGNQTNDGSGPRTYDAENRMLTATKGGVSSSYTYDADGRRVRRIIGVQETWHVYGIGGELLAEYSAGAAPNAPQKEYGYRNGQLLVIAEPGSGGNLAWGKATSQSSTSFGGNSSRGVDGNTNGNWGDNSVTHTNNEHQPWWQVDLGSVQQIGTVRLWNRTDCCSDRLSNFHVLVSDNPFSSTDLTTTINQAGVSNYYTAGQAGLLTEIGVGRSGRYVRV